MRKGEKREIQTGLWVPILLEQPHCVLSIPPNALWPSGQMFSQQKWLTAQNGAGKISVQRQQRARELLEKCWQRETHVTRIGGIGHDFEPALKGGHLKEGQVGPADVVKLHLRVSPLGVILLEAG